MTTRTSSLKRRRLASALPGAQFSEHHHRIVDAPVDACWDALHSVRWSDLTFTRPLFGVRAFGRTKGTPLDLDRRLVEPPSPGAPIHQDPPHYSTSATVGKPWTPTGVHVDVHDLDEVAAYAEPGWLKYGMDWTFTDLGDGRTLVETATLCEATDRGARTRFRAYWTIIRPFSGLIRIDILAALARRAEHR
ncbi:hypothetical protein GCM10027418_21450 [Mariniluteicoccus endophyticus]